MYKNYKIRLYPTEEQKLIIYNHINACRFVWNYMLELENTAEKDGKFLDYYDLKKNISNMKKSDEYSFLKNISSTSLTYVCKNLSNAYKMFFNKKAKHPKFKSKKRTKLKYPIRCDSKRFYMIDNNHIKIEKLGKIKCSDFLPYNCIKICEANIELVNEKWILNIRLECENQVFDLTDYYMGIDLGVKELAVVSYGDKQLIFHNIKKSKKIKTLESKKRHIQRVLSRKYKVNGNYAKTNNVLKYEKILKTIIFKLHNIRLDYIHKTTNQLVSLKPKRIVVEDLNLVGIEKNKHLSKSLKDQMFNEFIRQIEYKCKWNGIEFVKADRFYPSSKLCSCCGYKKIDLKLSDRIYKCDNCGLKIDRDYNAAINLMNYSI